MVHKLKYSGKLPNFFLRTDPPAKFKTKVRFVLKPWFYCREVLESHPTFGYAYSVYHEGNKVVDLYGGLFVI